MADSRFENIQDIFYDLRDAVENNLPDEPEEDVQERFDDLCSDEPTTEEGLLDAIGFLAHTLGDNFPDMADDEEQDELKLLLNQADLLRKMRTAGELA